MLSDDEIRALRDRTTLVPSRYTARIDPQTIAELCTRLLASEARVRALEEALSPFAEGGKRIEEIEQYTGERIDDNKQLLLGLSFTAGDFRRAHNALEAER